jgi:hypothetical protein
MLFKDNTLSFFFNRLLLRKTPVGLKYGPSKTLLITGALSLNTSSSLSNLRTYRYFSFLKLSRKKFDRGFFNLNSLSKFTLKKASPLVNVAAAAFVNSVDLRRAPSLLYKLSACKRYFVSSFFTTHLQKESLALSRHFVSSRIKISNFVFKNVSIFNWSSWNFAAVSFNLHAIYRTTRFFRLTVSSFTQQKPLLKLIVQNNTRLEFKFNSDSFFKKAIFENKKTTSRLTWASNVARTLLNFSSAAPNLLNLASLQKLNRLRRLSIIWTNKLDQRALTPVRRDFFSLNRKKLKYQLRLTKFILKFYKFKVFNLILKNEFNIKLILIRLNLSDNLNSSVFLLNLGLVYVNFIITKSLNFLICNGDSLNLVIHFKFLVYIKWLFLNFRANYRRFFFYLYKWRRRQRRVFPKQKSFRIPNWVKYQIFFRESMPIYIEADYLTLSFIVVLSPLDFRFFNYLSLRLNSVATLRSLNWKSLT